jgi:hypothetical protein
MFKDTKEGQTHYFGDGCKPPHRCPKETCKSAYNNVCKVCNLTMPTTPDIIEEILEEFDKTFIQNTDDERVSGWLAAVPAVLYPKYPLEGTKIANPGDVKYFLNAALLRVCKATLDEVKERAEGMKFKNDYKHPDVTRLITAFNEALSDLISSLKQ